MLNRIKIEQHNWQNYKPAHLSSESSIPSGLHDNHTSANLTTTSVQQVDQQVPFAAQDFHVQKTVKYQHDSKNQARHSGKLTRQARYYMIKIKNKKHSNLMHTDFESIPSE